MQVPGTIGTETAVSQLMFYYKNHMIGIIQKVKGMIQDSSEGK